MTIPHRTFPITEEDADLWRKLFEAPDQAELNQDQLGAPPAGWPSWPKWAAQRWPSLAENTYE